MIADDPKGQMDLVHDGLFQRGDLIRLFHCACRRVLAAYWAEGCADGPFFASNFNLYLGMVFSGCWRNGGVSTDQGVQMRVLVLTKRQYIAKDLLDDRYGRLFEIPAVLAARGHDVSVLAWSYRRRGPSFRTEGGVRWWSEDIWPFPFAHRQRLKRVVAETRPDVIWASSDAIHVVLAVRLGRRLGIPVVVDLYDDYEAFGLTKRLGLVAALRRACSKAAALSVISHTLSTTVRVRSPGAGPVCVIGNGVPEGFSVRAPRDEARRHLGLPLGVPLVGTAGALDASRGIEDLLLGFQVLQRRSPNVRLVLAGPRDQATSNAAVHMEGLIDLGRLSHDQVPWLYSALDVGVVCNRDSAFGRACHPMKLVEMAACGLPAVVAAVGDAGTVLPAANLYPPGDTQALADQLERQLETPQRVPSSVALPWSDLAISVEALLTEVIDAYRARTPSA